MKILLLSDFYPPVLGGMEKHVQSLAHGLINRGNEVVVFTSANEDSHSIEKNKPTIHRINGIFQKLPFLYKESKRRFPPPFLDVSLAKYMSKVVEIEKPDIIHAHGWILYSILGVKNDFNVPIVATLHDYGYICPKRTLIFNNEVCNTQFTTKCVSCAIGQYGYLKSLITYLGVKAGKRLNGVDSLIAVSQFVKDAYSRHFNDIQIEVIPNFIEPIASVALNGINNISNYILYIGELAPHKGVENLIKAFGLLKSRDIELVLIGRKHPACSYSQSDNIHIFENASDELLQGALSKARFVVIPSAWAEPCPTVAFEAMNFKKALIASNVGGLTDIVENNKSGILVPPNNVEMLARSIDFLLDNPQIAEEMGKNGFERLNKYFRADIIVPKIENSYKKLIEDHTMVNSSKP